ncbi:MAG TPA: DUF167 domain-containing protein [Gemmatimonadota bacterium]|nr:DUF167 domain-containing protein [Gemmatimonadota bacterium]
MRLAVKVVPRATREEVAGWLGDALKIRVRAAPEHGKANAAALEVLARSLELPVGRLRLVAGASSARKIIEIDGLDEAEIRRRLDRLE